MRVLRLVIILLAFVEAGLMAFDGTRALVVGEFITPKSGPYAGQVGPWRFIVQRVGVNPTGTPMKVAFAVIGWAWLTIAAGFAAGQPWSLPAMLAAAIATVWFLPFGTVFSVVQIVLLLVLRSRAAPT
jgi:hypothetical protein